MARNKQTRKQRAVAAKAEEARRAAQPPSKKDILEDGPARVSSCLWAISLTFGYGVLNDLILRRPERQVNLEAVGVCAVTLVINFYSYYSRSHRAKFSHRITEPLWAAIQRFNRMGLAPIAGVSALTCVLALCATPVGNIEPEIAARRLQISDIGLVPGADPDLRGTEPAYRFREVSTRIERTIDERVPGDPSSVRKVSNSLANIVLNVRLSENVSQAAKLELAYLQSYETLSQIGMEDPRALQRTISSYTRNIPTVIGAGVDKTTFYMTPSDPEFTEVGPNPMFFSDFTVISLGHNPESPPPQFAVTNASGTAVVFNNVKVEGLAQDIGALTWTNVTFQECLIRYHGQPVRMGNVRFINCTFERPPDGRGHRFLDFLSTHQGQLINAYTP